MQDSAEGFEEISDQAGSSFDWREYYHAIVERVWIVILLTVLGLATAAYVLTTKESLYRARSVLFLETEKERILGRVEAVRDVQIRSLDMVNTVVDTLDGYPFALRVAQRLNLGKNEAFLKAATGETKEISDAEAAGLLAKMVIVNYRKMTRLIDIFVTSRDPQVSTTLANAMANEYLRLTLEQSTETTRSAGQSLVDEAERLAKKMRLSEEAMQSFRERERSASLETMLSEAENTLKELAQQIAATELRATQIDNDLVASKGKEKDMEALLQLPTVAGDPQVTASSVPIERLGAEISLLSQRYKSEHPLLVSAKRQLELARDEQTRQITETLSRLQIESTRLKDLLVTLRTSRATAEDRVVTVTGKSIEYNSLSRELATDRTLYESILSRLKEVDATKSLSDEPARIHELAIGAGPIPVGTLKILLMGLVGGFAAGVGLVLLLNQIDSSIRTLEQAETYTGLRVITAVPRAKKGDPGLITVDERSGPLAEAFRTLRTSIALVSGKEAKRMFLFTSAFPAEGKTFSSSNFAVTLAQQGFRTLLVDADLRKPSVSKLFFQENRKPGLTEILHGEIGLAGAIRPTGVENLSVITAGGRSDNPAELLTGPRVKGFFDEIRASYDRIVIDSAPVLAVSDTLLIVGFADMNCLVVRAYSTPRKSVQQAIRLLSRAGSPPAGLLVNRTIASRAYEHYGSYGSRGVYGAGMETQKKA